MKYFRENKFLKGVSVFLMVSFLNTILFPTVSYALTAGPTAPEYTSFEPVDTTDMVDLATGDFTYNIPLLEVPGPEGGYPLSLSYHAGVTPDQESSWAGLSWNVNPGAINRMVNGHPDDLLNASQVTTDSWPGGQTNTYSVGVGFGVGGLNYNVGLDFATDTYRGFGVGGSAGVGGPMAYGTGGGVSVGVSPYGDVTYAQLNGGMGIGNGTGIGTGLTVASTPQGTSTQVSTSISYQRLNASISTGKGGTYGSIGGTSFFNIGKTKIGSVQNKSEGMAITIPTTAININLAYNINRYWINSLDNAILYGALYAPSLNNPTSSVSFDCTSMISENNPNPRKSDPDAVMGGSRPAFDSYIVAGQGIGGSMQPYYYENGAMTRKGSTADYNYKNYLNKVSFRFNNDFSNSCVYNDSWTSPTLASIKDITSAVGAGKVDYNTGYSFSDFSKPKGMLAGSRYIEWFTNAEITDNKYKDPYYTKFCPYFMPDQKGRLLTAGGYQLGLNNHIGGFIITNESGVSYHYTIPVYNFENVTKIYRDNELTRTIERKAPYAYTWLLTAITGPDFVDRGAIGEFDEADYGYWVKFDYGRWTNQYKWRTPETGTESDNLAGTKVYTAGKKELYYLNSIRTRTHTALFIKSMKKDGKSVSDPDNGGFNVIRDGNNNVTAFSVCALKLDKILLFNNSVLTDKLVQNFNNVSSLAELNMNGGLMVNFGGVNYMNGKDVLDSTDLISGRKVSGYDLSKDAFRQIVFSYDYSLCKNTPNSFDLSYASFTKGNTDGKLTLTKVEYLGKNGETIIPSTQFEYAKKYDFSPGKDLWGYYKSDYPTSYADNVEKNTTVISSLQVDAWSLTKIKTGLGADINISYESDKYYKSVLNNFRNLAVSRIDTTAISDQFKLTVFSSEILTNYADLVAGKKVSLKSVLKQFYPLPHGGQGYNVKRYEDDVAEVVSVGADYIILKTQALKNFRLESMKEYYCPDQFLCSLLAANIIFDRGTSEFYGGGLRVKSIGVKSGVIENVTTYEYFNGVTASEPSGLNVQYRNNNYTSIALNASTNEKMDYENVLYLKSLKAVAGQQVSSPFVVYSKVIVRDKVIDSYGSPVEIPTNSYKEFIFLTADDNWVSTTESTLISNSATKEYAKLFKLRDFRGRVGLLKSVTQYGASGSLSKSENIYLHNQAGATFTGKLDTLFNNQGRIDQVYFERRDVNGDKQLMVTKVEEFPVVLVGTKFTDYKKGLVQESKILGYDFYSGMPNLEISKDAFGKTYKTKTVFAYWKFPAMGSKIFSTSNKHMLSQTTGSYVFRVDANKANPAKETDYTETGLLSAQVDYWTNNLNVEGLDAGATKQSDIWRKECSYYWVGEDTVALNPNGTYKRSKFADFNYASTTNNFWQQTGKVTLVDAYSHVLESEDINSVKSSVLMNPKRHYVTASVSGSPKNETAYMSCEYPSEYPSSGVFEGNVEVLNGKIFYEPDYAHTGNYSLQVPSGKDGFRFRFTPRANVKYKASVWVYLPGIKDGYGSDISDQSLNVVRIQYKKGTTIQKQEYRKFDMKARNQYLLSLDFAPTDGTTQIDIVCRNENAGRPVYFDDFRVHPVYASFSSYVYDLPTGKLTYILDQNNFFTHFTYNNKGQLIRTSKELLKYPAEMTIMEQGINYGKTQ